MPVEVGGSTLSSKVTVLPEVEVRGRIAGTYERLKPGPGKSHETVASHQRARIQRAMAQLVAAGGRRVVTVRKLTKLAGVSTATFYAHFDGTDECLLSTYVSLMAGIRERIASTRAPFTGPQEQGEVAIRALLDALVEDPEAARLALIEVVDAGPAAIGPMRAQETMLESVLREALDRRGRRVSPFTVAWVTAGLLHCARQLLDFGIASVKPEETQSILRWGRVFLAEPELPSTKTESSSSPDAYRSLHRVEGAPPRGNETELILSAVLKLACTKGYWKLSVPEASKVAGIPATHFKRNFASLDQAYLLAVERAARRLFAGFGSRASETNHDWKQALRDEIAALSFSLASDPETASVVFAGVLAPGAAGLTRREALIDELALTWAATVPVRVRPAAFVAKASMASLWNAVARATEMGRATDLPRQIDTNANLFLWPMVSQERQRATAASRAAPVGPGASD